MFIWIAWVDDTNDQTRRFFFASSRETVRSNAHAYCVTGSRNLAAANPDTYKRKTSPKIMGCERLKVGDGRADMVGLINWLARMEPSITFPLSIPFEIVTNNPENSDGNRNDLDNAPGDTGHIPVISDT